MSTTDDPCWIQVGGFVMKGMAGYRIKQYAKQKNIPVSLAVKELLILGLQSQGLLSPKYTLSDMRQGA